VLSKNADCESVVSKGGAEVRFALDVECNKLASGGYGVRRRVRIVEDVETQEHLGSEDSGDNFKVRFVDRTFGIGNVGRNEGGHSIDGRTRFSRERRATRGRGTDDMGHGGTIGHGNIRRKGRSWEDSSLRGRSVGRGQRVRRRFIIGPDYSSWDREGGRGSRSLFNTNRSGYDWRLGRGGRDGFIGGSGR
jgi:hypothetical protein